MEIHSEGESDEKPALDDVIKDTHCSGGLTKRDSSCPWARQQSSGLDARGLGHSFIDFGVFSVPGLDQIHRD